MNQDIFQIPIPLESPLSSVVIFLVLACIPIFLLCFTSFIKLNVVFNILRNAIGVGQIPSAAIIFIMSFVLSIYIFAPVAVDIKNATIPILQEAISSENAVAKTSPKKNVPSARGTGVTINLNTLSQIATEAAAPLKNFLLKHSRMKERVFFANLRNKTNYDEPANESVDELVDEPDDEPVLAQPDEIVGEDIFSIIPAFLISELRLAFIIGFMLYVPFLVVELVVGHILLAINMTMLSPQVVSAPIKILFFVLSDAWYLLCKSLVLGGYA